MKNIYAFLLAFLFSGTISAGGYELYFCSKLDKDGKCLGRSEEFKWTGDKMQLNSVVRNTDKLKTNKLIYKVFFMKNDHGGEIAAELTRYTKADRNLAFKSIYFFKAGYYKVDVFNEKNELLVSSFLTITEREMGPK